MVHVLVVFLVPICLSNFVSGGTVCGGSVYGRCILVGGGSSSGADESGHVHVGAPV